MAQKTIKRIKSFEDACQVVLASENEKILLAYNGQNKRLIAAQAFLKLCIITEALNEGWTPNWNNDNDYKYYQWWNMQNGFSLINVCYFYSSGSRVSSRLCFKSRELAEYAAKQFFDIYKDYFTI
jgi:hypothetical protein